MKRTSLDFFDTITTLIICLLIPIFYYQFSLQGLHYSVCILQGSVFAFLAFGLILNFIYGKKHKYYFLMTIITLINAFIMITQIIFHLLNYGGAINSTHIYIWTLVVCAILALYTAIRGLELQTIQK